MQRGRVRRTAASSAAAAASVASGPAPAAAPFAASPFFCLWRAREAAPAPKMATAQQCASEASKRSERPRAERVGPSKYG